MMSRYPSISLIQPHGLFSRKAFKQSGSRRSLEHAHHGRYNAALLNEIDLALKNRWRVTVEADDETTHDLQSRSGVSFLTSWSRSLILVVGLAAFGETVRSSGDLDADKDGIKSGRGHHVMSSGSSARLIEASVKKTHPFLSRRQWIRAGSRLLLQRVCCR
jgi:hypothetical protein